MEVERPRKVRMMEIMVRTKRTTRYMNGIHGAEGNESKRYLPIYLLMEKMNFGFVPMVSVISAPQRVTDGLAIFLDIRARKPIPLPNI